MLFLFKIAKTSLYLSLILLVATGRADTAIDREMSIHKAVETARQRGIADAVIVDLLADGFEVGLSAERMAPLVDVLSQARQADLPLSPLLAKIHEGLRKKIDPQQLTASMQKRIDDFQFVDRLLRHKYPELRKPDRSDLTALVECLDLGLSHESLSRFLEQAPDVDPNMLAVAANNQALMNQLGFPKHLTEDMLLTGLNHGQLTSHWSGLFKLAAAARRKGVSDDRFTVVVKQVLSSGGDPAQVLKALEFTSRDVRHGPYWRPAPQIENQH